MKKIIAYKAFDMNMTCRGYKYEVGKTYHHEGPIEACESGFHACENPIDCLNYYDITDSRFAVVEMSGETDMCGNDSKIASAQITIQAELNLPEYIKKCVDWLIESIPLSGSDSGYYAQLAASGDYAKLAASGYNAQLAASGNYAKLAASGYNAQLAASGYYAQLAASGDYAQRAASGYNAKLAASGDYAKLAASRNYAKLAASGNYAQLAASGNYAKLAASGNYAKLAASGDKSVIASSSINSIAKGAVGTWISLAEYVDGECVGFATGRIGYDGLKPDVFYRASGGNLVEAE